MAAPARAESPRRTQVERRARSVEEPTKSGAHGTGQMQARDESIGAGGAAAAASWSDADADAARQDFCRFNSCESDAALS
jgi:hypothetical protein